METDGSPLIRRLLGSVTLLCREEAALVETEQIFCSVSTSFSLLSGSNFRCGC